MTDKNKLVCLLSKICPIPYREIAKVADCLVKNGYTIATDNNVGDKWIPVTERLPEQGQEVIVYTGNILSPVVMAYKFWCKDYTTWLHVTHWMPLPEPPKED